MPRPKHPAQDRAEFSAIAAIVERVPWRRGPLMLNDVLNRAAAGFDIAVSRALLGRSRAARARSRTESLGHAERIAALERITATWESHALAPGFFGDEKPATPGLAFVRMDGDVKVVDATWPSAFAPVDDGARGRYLERTENATAAARLFLHREPRPAVILIHGYRAGHFALEERVWPLRFMLDRGLDVALFVLPFHAVRARRAGAAFFPSSDPRITNEGFRQAMIDLRSLGAHLRQRGAPAVGVMGMSLGGYTSALAATVDPSLAFAVPIIPLASLADVARAGGRFVGTADEQRLQYDALVRAHRTISPLHRPPQIAADRILVAGAVGDRITPIEHARGIAEHFGAPLEEFVGGHLLSFGRGTAFRAAFRLLGRLQLLR
jgi:pimeloyl-ACP methyl ester carboxylesterase